MLRTPRAGKRACFLLCLAVVGFFLYTVGLAQAANPTNITFDALFVDTGGLETEVSNLVFYWEEKLSETQLALHELKHVPAKRGAVPIQIQFAGIKQIAFKPSSNKEGPILSITLKNGKTGDFHLAISGSFKGQTHFGALVSTIFSPPRASYNTPTRRRP